MRGGVLTSSAGNFGQGLALAARDLGIPVTVVVPEASALTKATALAELGAKVVRVPFGGGGLAAAIGSVMRRISPGVKMVVAESEASQPAAAALANGGPVRVPHIQSFVDGMGSTSVLEDMWPLVRQTIDQAVCASFLQIVETVRLLAARHHVIAEAAGAASLAVALAGMAGKGNIACIVSGGNIDPPKLGDILNGRNPF